MDRWSAVITYRKNAEDAHIVRATFAEFSDLHDIIERGPNFYAIESVIIALNDKRMATTMDADA